MSKIFNRDIELSGDAKITKNGSTLIDKDGNVTANIQDTLAQGSIYVGNSSGVTSEVVAKTSGQILVGSGTTLASVAVTGDISLSSAGVATLGQSTVDAGNTAGIVPADATTEDRILLVKRYSWDFADADANDDLVINNADLSNIEIVDVWLDMTTAEGGAMTLTLRDAANGGGNAITSALDCNVTTIERTASLANNSLGALASLYGNFSGNPGTAAGVLYISYVKTAV